MNVLGGRPAQGTEQLARVGFVAQDTPTYVALTVADHLRLGAWLNPRWDNDTAKQRIEQIGLDRHQRVRSLSGGQRARLALTLAIAKRPDLLILDEPIASLDPLARREFLQALSQVVSERGVSVILSSHLVADLERVCDYVVVLVASRVRIAGAIDELLSLHRRVTGPHRDFESLPTGCQVIEARHAEGQSTYLVRGADLVVGPEWTVEEINLEDIVLAYMGKSEADAGSAPRSEVA